MKPALFNLFLALLWFNPCAVEARPNILFLFSDDHGEERVLSAGLSKGFSDSDRIKIWDAESGEVVKDFKVVGGFISCAAMSPDEKRIVYGCGSKDVVVMDAESGKVLKRIEEHELGVMSVAISPDGKRFVV